MKKEIKISYLNRQGVRRDLSPVPKLVLASHILEKYGFSIGDKVLVKYSQNKIIIIKK